MWRPLSLRLLQNADYDVKRAEIGIVYIDEIDKIGRKTDNVSITPRRLRRRRPAGPAQNPRRHGVQRPRRRVAGSTPTRNTFRLTPSASFFICGGAFVGLDKIIRRRVGSNTLGFGRPHTPPVAVEAELPPTAVLRHVEPEDLLNFGLIPEFIGRLPMISVLEELTEEELVCVLTDTKNALTKQYTKLFSMDNVGLTFTKDAPSRPGPGSPQKRDRCPEPCAPSWRS